MRAYTKDDGIGHRETVVTEPTCPACGKPALDGRICKKCADEMRAVMQGGK